MNVPAKPRNRPNWQVIAAQEKAIDALMDKNALAEQSLDAMRRRLNKWALLAGFVGFLVGGILGRALQ